MSFREFLFETEGCIVGAFLESMTAVYSIIQFNRQRFLEDGKSLLGEDMEAIPHSPNGFIAYMAKSNSNSELLPKNDVVLHVLESIGFAAVRSPECAISGSVLLFKCLPSGDVASLSNEDFDCIMGAYCTY
jgi:hypothetical protein